MFYLDHAVAAYYFAPVFINSGPVKWRISDQWSGLWVHDISVKVNRWIKNNGAHLWYFNLSCQTSFSHCNKRFWKILTVVCPKEVCQHPPSRNIGLFRNPKNRITTVVLIRNPYVPLFYITFFKNIMHVIKTSCEIKCSETSKCSVGWQCFFITYK